MNFDFNGAWGDGANLPWFLFLIEVTGPTTPAAPAKAIEVWVCTPIGCFPRNCVLGRTGRSSEGVYG